ncbi:hypothetical protein CROQUDRAFT_694746 [Cronartium quercuum f. sp. fusiforme G11]|uniref:chitin deacetylase n=1 Tax=Cronartium quercuum f. sp. fusiforme G11 TaxID=708437 RepID=A0A9P6TDG4_9BASI|nr:hypothetical protein CROQUDRAFT_694746 [Cronartium quercuum f. sp. fusiforme G11]
MRFKNAFRICPSSLIYLWSIFFNWCDCAQPIPKLFENATDFSKMKYPHEDVSGPKPLTTWIAAYEEVKAKGLIPHWKPSVVTNGEPSYASYSDAELASPEKVCSWTIAKCVMPDDIVTAPKGQMGISFDDGPQEATSLLLPFLLKKNQKATHFMIGSRIMDNPNLLKQAVSLNHDHIAAHTWSLMTTLTDEQAVGEIGWSIQIIRDNVGLIPAYWRPPFGDVDNRIRAIATHVFNLRTVMWSDDVNDWCLSDESAPTSSCLAGSGPQNSNELAKELNQIINQTKGPQQRDSGIIILEHEIAKRPVEEFIKAYNLAQKVGWIMKPIPDLFGYVFFPVRARFF